MPTATMARMGSQWASGSGDLSPASANVSQIQSRAAPRPVASGGWSLFGGALMNEPIALRRARRPTVGDGLPSAGKLARWATPFGGPWGQRDRLFVCVRLQPSAGKSDRAGQCSVPAPTVPGPQLPGGAARLKGARGPDPKGPRGPAGQAGLGVLRCRPAGRRRGATACAGGATLVRGRAAPSGRECAASGGSSSGCRSRGAGALEEAAIRPHHYRQRPGAGSALLGWRWRRTSPRPRRRTPTVAFCAHSLPHHL